MKYLIIFLFIFPNIVFAEELCVNQNNVYNTYNFYESTYIRGAAGAMAQSGIATGRFNSQLVNIGLAVSTVGNAEAIAAGISISPNYFTTIGFKLSRERSNIYTHKGIKREDLDGGTISINWSF